MEIAGTPDKKSPYADGHQTEDVEPFDLAGYIDIAAFDVVTRFRHSKYRDDETCLVQSLHNVT